MGGGSGHTSAIPPELICGRGRGWFVVGPGLWAEFDHQDLCHRTGGKVGVVANGGFFEDLERLATIDLSSCGISVYSAHWIRLRIFHSNRWKAAKHLKII